MRALRREFQILLVGGDRLLPAFELFEVARQQLVDDGLRVGELREGLLERLDGLVVPTLLFVDERRARVRLGLEAARLAQRAREGRERRVVVRERALDAPLDRPGFGVDGAVGACAAFSSSRASSVLPCDSSARASPRCAAAKRGRDLRACRYDSTAAALFPFSRASSAC